MIIIFVERKLPRREVPEGQTIPSVWIAGISYRHPRTQINYKIGKSL